MQLNKYLSKYLVFIISVPPNLKCISLHVTLLLELLTILFKIICTNCVLVIWYYIEGSIFSMKICGRNFSLISEYEIVILLPTISLTL